MAQEDNSPKMIESIFMGFLLQVDINRDVKQKDSFRRCIEKSISSNLQEIITSSITLSNKNLVAEDDFFYKWDLYDSDLLEINLSTKKLTVKSAWNLTYALRSIDGVLYAEPRFALILPSGTSLCLTLLLLRNNFDCVVSGERPRRLDNLIRQINNPEWHLDQMQVKQAWEKFKEKHPDIEPGSGVVIAHTDTGYLPHPELDNLLKHETGEIPDTTLQLKKQALEHDNFPTVQWHGTATASLITSPPGQQISNQNSQAKSSVDDRFYVTGVAPGASIKPYRINTLGLDYEYFSPNLSHAINAAALEAANDSKNQNKLRVLSISLGGYPTLAIRRAIINARRQGIIVVASAGNRVPFAVWPAAYDGVIAVASSSFNLALAKLSTEDFTTSSEDNYSSVDVLLSNEGKIRIANHSSRGSRVDVAAPGDLVCVAMATRVQTKDGGVTLDYSVYPQSGTSYAAPLVAGLAAMWLSYHGWDTLMAKYRVPARIPLVFDKLLRDTCYTPSEWDSANWGNGIVNAYNLLQADLPDPEDPYIQVPLAYSEVDHVPLDRGGIESFAHLFEQTLSTPRFLQGITTKVNEELNALGESLLGKAITLSPTQWILEQFLQKSGKELRQFLRTFGQEILFHFGTNLTLYQQMVNAMNQAVGLPFASEDDFQSVLSALKEVASVYLRDNLESPSTTNH